MTPVIMALPDGTTHLANTGARDSWCGKSVANGVAFKWEPGCDWGEHKRDCLECIRALVRLRDFPAVGGEQ